MQNYSTVIKEIEFKQILLWIIFQGLKIEIMNSDSDSDWDSMSEAPKAPVGVPQGGKKMITWSSV